jgi:hypothetical protein
VVERARLESEYTGNRIGGSNPPLSAITCDQASDIGEIEGFSISMNRKFVPFLVPQNPWVVFIES